LRPLVWVRRPMQAAATVYPSGRARLGAKAHAGGWRQSRPLMPFWSSVCPPLARAVAGGTPLGPCFHAEQDAESLFAQATRRSRRCSPTSRWRPPPRRGRTRRRTRRCRRRRCRSASRGPSCGRQRRQPRTPTPARRRRRPRRCSSRRSSSSRPGRPSLQLLRRHCRASVLLDRLYGHQIVSLFAK
jgi:hypothetical protein